MIDRRRAARPRRRGERGSALVLAILILFAMLGLGLLAMRTATQNAAGSGNLRLNKQARYVAEAGLSAAVAAMNRSDTAVVDGLVASWNLATAGGPTAIVLDHTGAARVVRLDEDGAPVGGPVFQGVLPVAPLLDRGPDPLGLMGQAGALRTSYEVRVEGLQRWSDPTTDTGEVRSSGPCLMHFVARGTVASRTIDDDGFEASRDDVRFAEHTLRAGVVIDVSNPDQCLAQVAGGAP